MSYLRAAGGAEVAGRDVRPPGSGSPSSWAISLLDREQRSWSSDVLGVAVAEHLELVELVDAEDAARVLAGGAGLAAEAGREADVAQRQVRLGQGLAACIAGRVAPPPSRRGRARQPERVHLRLGLGEEARGGHRFRFTSTGGITGTNPFGGQLLEAPLDERELEPDEVALQVVEAAPRARAADSGSIRRRPSRRDRGGRAARTRTPAASRTSA